MFKFTIQAEVEALHCTILLIDLMGMERVIIAMDHMVLKQEMLSPIMDYVPLRLKFKHLKFSLLTSFIEPQIVIVLLIVIKPLMLSCLWDMVDGRTKFCSPFDD